MKMSGLTIGIILVLQFLKIRLILGDHGWDHLQFAQSWPQAFCSSNECNYPSTFRLWNVHGLWPKATKGKSPAYCFNATKFDLNKLKPIKSELEKVWINLKDAAHPKTPWQHEWKAHGSCTEGSKRIKNQLMYFNITIQLKKKYNITSVLRANSIYASNSQPLQNSKVLPILEKAFGNTVMLRCQNISIGKTVWSEVRVCFDPNLTRIDCPKENAFLSSSDLRYVSKNDDSTFPCPDKFLFLERPMNVDFDKIIKKFKHWF